LTAACAARISINNPDVSRRLRTGFIPWHSTNGQHRLLKIAFIYRHLIQSTRSEVDRIEWKGSSRLRAPHFLDIPAATPARMYSQIRFSFGMQDFELVLNTLRTENAPQPGIRPEHAAVKTPERAQSLLVIDVRQGRPMPADRAGTPVPNLWIHPAGNEPCRCAAKWARCQDSKQHEQVLMQFMVPAELHQGIPFIGQTHPEKPHFVRMAENKHL
jgi:hypothetical protein